MKYLLVFILTIGGLSIKAQTVGGLISQVNHQDKYLDTVFSRFKTAEWKADSLYTIASVKMWIDSANKYIRLSERYIANDKLDSCIDAIHTANKFIEYSKKRLKISTDN